MENNYTVYISVSKEWLNVEWTFHQLILDIADQIKREKGATIVNERNCQFVQDDIPHVIYDCELLLHDKQNDSLTLISFFDNMSRTLSLFEKRNNPKDLVCYSQLSKTNLFEQHRVDNRKYRIVPNIHIPSFSFHTADNPVDKFYNKRQETDKSKFFDKMIFRGTAAISATCRMPILLLNGHHYFTGHDYHPDYFDELTYHKVGLSVPGVGEVGMRDLEYMSVGIPMLRMEYTYPSPLNPPLIPNYHYIAIDRIDPTSDEERMGGKNPFNYAMAYLNKFEEIKDDQDLLDFISKNSRKYYEDYLHVNVRQKHIMEISEIA